MKLETQNSYVTNPQFVGGAAVIPTSGSEFASYNANNPQFGFVAGWLYFGEIVTFVVKTYYQSVFTLLSASGFIPGIITAVSASSTAGNIVALK